MDEIKYVIGELNKPPFERNFNVITYDSLRPEQRLDLLFQIFKHIDPTTNVDLFHALEPEEMVIQILETLRVYKYTPPAGLDPSSFRQAIIMGDRSVMSNIMAHLLRRMVELKKRAYLARFLVKIELAPEVEGDNDVTGLYNQYEQLIEDFKVAHSTTEQAKRSISSVQEIQQDIRSMERERDQVTAKIEQIRRRVDPDLNKPLFEVCKKFQDEKLKLEKNRRLLEQQESDLKVLDGRHERLVGVQREVESTYEIGSATPSLLIERLRDEVDSKRTLVRDVLPQELIAIQRTVRDLEEIEAAPSGMVGDFLDKLHAKLQTVNQEVSELVERKMLRNDSTGMTGGGSGVPDDKLASFRKSAWTTSKKKQTLQEKVRDMESEIHRIQTQLDSKRMNFHGGESSLMKGETLKGYVGKLREMSHEYKSKRALLTEFRTENGTLARTQDCLTLKDKSLTEKIVSLEDKKGLSGYFAMQEEKRSSGAAPGGPDGPGGPDHGGDGQAESIDDLRESVSRLSASINDRKSGLAPVIKDLRPLRQQQADLQAEYDQKKAAYDQVASGLEARKTTLETDLERLRGEVDKLTRDRYVTLERVEILKVKEKLVKGEIPTGSKSDRGGSSQGNFVQLLEQEVAKEKKSNEALHLSQRELRDNEDHNQRQAKIWSDLRAIFEVKSRQLDQEARRKAENKFNMNSENRLVVD